MKKSDETVKSQQAKEKSSAAKTPKSKKGESNIIEASKHFLQDSSHKVEDTIRKQVKSKKFQKGRRLVLLMLIFMGRQFHIC